MKIVCVGRNYVAHARELGNEVPSDPVIFIKPATALSSPDTPFSIPSFSNEIHYECELVLRIAKPVRQLKKEETLSCIDAITAGIDFTARDLQQQLKEKGLPWEKAKAWDQSAVVGKFIPIEAGMKMNDINFCLYKNKGLVQMGNTAQMIYGFDFLVAHISQFFSLNIGDLIFTGTPKGVGECVVGDVLEGFLEDESVFELEVK